jgi:hypothetical protein
MSTSTKTTLDLRGPSGNYVVREVMRFAFFVRRPHREVAPVAVEVIDRLIDLFSPPALTMFSIESGDWLAYDAKGLKTQVRNRMLGAQVPLNGSVSLSGDQANIPDFGVDYEGIAIDRATFSKSASHLRFFVSADALPAFFGPVLRLAREIAEQLGCSAAYADLALEGDQARMQALARRYRCLDISDVSCVAEDIEDKLPGVYWKNLIGSRLCSALGGRAKLESILSSDAAFEESDSGDLIITLGTEPTRGDVNRHGQSLADRIALARLAHERGLLHVPRAVVYFDSEDELSDVEAQETWHLRFAQRDGNQL